MSEPLPVIIKGHSGGPNGKWDEVQAVQHEPFIYISYCGNSDENGIAELLEMLGRYRLAVHDRGEKCYTVNPCHWADNPKYDRWDKDSKEEQYIDGPRMYACDGVVRFSGNFERYAFAFGIDTNHKPTIEALLSAIRANESIPDGDL